MAGGDNNYPNNGGRHNGGRGRGRFNGRFAKKGPNKNKSKNGLYVNGIFQGRNKKYTVVRDSSEDQSDEMEQLIKDTIGYARDRADLQKVGKAMKFRENKTDFIPTYPDEDEYSQELEVQAIEDGNVLKDSRGRIIMKTVRIVTNQSKKDELIAKFNREYSHGYKAKDQYEDGVGAALEFIEGQVEEATWKRIERSSHPSSGKTFQQHAAAYEIVECIECMEQVCGVNGDEEYSWKPAEFFDKSAE